MKTTTTNHKDTYAYRDSWMAYASLYWCNDQEKIKNTVKHIVKNLDLDQDSKEISVLALGLGIGTFEFPLLRVLKEETGKEIRIVAIDLYKQPLYFASHLVSEGLENLPKSSGDFIAKISSSECSHYWDDSVTDEYKLLGNHLFVSDNLDEDEKNIPDWDNLAAFKSMPPDWKGRLLKNHAESLPKPNGGFDLAIASFCLFHLPNWWRFTLVNALSFLKAGGVFLHSSIEGDVAMIEGYQSSAYNFLSELGIERSFHSNRIMKQVFLDGLYKDNEVENYLKKPRPSNALNPFSINEFLSHLEPEIGRVFESGYVFQNEVSRDMYLTILKKGTCSPARKIKSLVGEVRFNSLVAAVEKQLYYSDLSFTDRIVNKINWMGFKKLSDSKAFEDSPIVRKFISKTKL